MSSILEIRDRVMTYYARFVHILEIAARFLVSLVLLIKLNGQIGCYEGSKQTLLTLIIALVCAVIPAGSGAILVGLLALFYLYKLSLIAALVGAGLFLLFMLLYFRFSPRDGMILMLTPILASMGLPYVLALAAGLFCTPFSVAAFAVGLFSRSYIEFAAENAESLAADGLESYIASFHTLIDGLMDDKSAVVLIIVFAAGVTVTFVIRILRIPYSWYIAPAAGGVVQIIALLVGRGKFECDLSAGGAILGILLGVVVAEFLVFLFFDFDYDRSEYLRFSDDDYYYYVHAVPRNVSGYDREDTYYEDRRREPVQDRYAEDEEQYPGDYASYDNLPEEDGRDSDYGGNSEDFLYTDDGE